MAAVFRPTHCRASSSRSTQRRSRAGLALDCGCRVASYKNTPARFESAAGLMASGVAQCLACFCPLLIKQHKSPDALCLSFQLLGAGRRYTDFRTLEDTLCPTL